MGSVAQRCVFFVSGFDPKGAAHYHALYRDEALRAAADGWRIVVGGRERQPDGNPFWRVGSGRGSDRVQTRYEFMRWDDVVRAHWPRNRVAVWRDYFRTSWFNLRCGALARMAALSWPAAAALLMPLALATLSVLAALAGGVAAFAAVSAAYRSTGVTGAAALATAALVAGACAQLESRFALFWMMRSYAFTRLQALGRAPDLEARLDAQAARLAERLRACVDDEVLVVGHSSGAIMAVEIVARAKRLLQGADAALPVSLLTIGSVIPLLGTLPHAVCFRRSLEALATMPAIDWVDFSAPPDGCCFALTDPMAACGESPAHRMTERMPDRPKLLNPRFAQCFDAQQYRALRRDKFRMHFQYLMALPTPDVYDYFAITAGNLRLAERYAGNPSVHDFDRLRWRGTSRPAQPRSA